MGDIATYPSLRDRTVLVTGGGGGIGGAIVRHFVAQGSKVGFLDIDEIGSKALVAALEGEGTVHFERCDLTDIEALRAAIGRVRERLGPITILINNAAHDERHAIEDVTPDYWDQRLAVNLKHQFFAAQAVMGDMKAWRAAVDGSQLASSATRSVDSHACSKRSSSSMLTAGSVVMFEKMVCICSGDTSGVSVRKSRLRPIGSMICWMRIWRSLM